MFRTVYLPVAWLTLSLLSMSYGLAFGSYDTAVVGFTMFCPGSFVMVLILDHQS